MVLGIISLAATIPLIASSTLSLQNDAQNTRADLSTTRWKEGKSHLLVRASTRSPLAHRTLFPPVQSSSSSLPSSHACVVLYRGKLYIEAVPPQQQNQQHQQQEAKAKYHPFTGYFLAFPDRAFEGLASTISVEPPLLNWIYLNPESLQLCHGVRADTEAGMPGPFDLVAEQKEEQPATSAAEGERRLSFEGWEGFLAVETEETASTGLWELRFDRMDDGLKGKIAEGRVVVEIELVWVGIEGKGQQDP